MRLHFPKSCRVPLPAILILLFTWTAFAVPFPSQEAGALQSQPDSTAKAVTQFEDAQRLVGEGKFEEALAAVQAVAVRNPNVPGIDKEFGVIYYKKGDHIKAIDSFNKALAQDPSDKESTQLLGLS